MPLAITKPRFRDLPKSEQTALRGGIAALNSAVAYKAKRAATSAREVAAAAFANCADLHASDERDPLLDSIEAMAMRKGLEGREDLKQRSRDVNYVTAMVEMGDMLEQLIKDKRLLARGGTFSALAATFNSHVKLEPADVVLNPKGFAEIDFRMRFKTALGLAAWTIIRLSQLRSYGHVVLRCAECREFKIVSISKRQRFCSKQHRTLFNVHKLRARLRVVKPRRPK
jgi:hypothetical protein